MSHTYIASRTNFIHDGDYTGMVEIRPQLESGAIAAIEIPIEDLFDFAASMVADKRISKLEDASWAQILGVGE